MNPTWMKLTASTALIAVLGVPAFATQIARWSLTEAPAGVAYATDAALGLAVSPHASAGNVAHEDGAARLRNPKSGDGAAGLLAAPDHPALTGHADGGAGLQSLAIEVEVKLDSLTDQAQIVRKIDGDSGYELYITKSGKVGFRVKGEKGAGLLTSKNTMSADGKWHRIAVNWEGDLEIYNFQVRVDDVVSWATRTPGALTDTAAPLTIGGLQRDNGTIGQPLDGWVRNLVISTDRKDLLDKSGVIDPTPAKPTGAHLLDQPGLLAAGFVADPPPTPECHAGTLAERPDGRVVVAWFGGTREGHIDVGIWASEFDGEAWSAPREIVQPLKPDGTHPSRFNPVLFQYPDHGPMALFHLSGALGEAEGNLSVSRDGGATWTEPARLPDGVRGPTKNKPILLDDGTLLCPDNGSSLKFDRTRDGGQTWLEPSVAPDPQKLGAIQPALLKHRDGRVQALGRSQSGAIVTTWSSDGGATWSPLEKTSLPNNFSGVDAITLADGRHLLVYNHAKTPEGKWGGPRTPLNVAVSDDGVNWSAAVVLEDEPGEYSYPAVIQASDGTVHVLYTWHRVRMKHAVLDPRAFSLRPIVGGEWPAQ